MLISCRSLFEPASSCRSMISGRFSRFCLSKIIGSLISHVAANKIAIPKHLIPHIIDPPGTIRSGADMGKQLDSRIDTEMQARKPAVHHIQMIEYPDVPGDVAPPWHMPGYANFAPKTEKRQKNTVPVIGIHASYAGRCSSSRRKTPAVMVSPMPTVVIGLSHVRRR